MRSFLSRFGATLFLSLLVAGTAGCGGTKRTAKAPASDGVDGHSGPAKVGGPAPDLSIQTINGKGKVSRESLEGKIAVIDFWATWCPPCKDALPKLEEIAKASTGKIEVVGISVDDKIEGVDDFAKANGVTFAIGWDEGHAIADRWVLEGMPTTYILDATGTVRFIHSGFRSGEADVMAKELASLSSETPSTPAKKTEVASSASPAGGSSRASSSTSSTPARTSSNEAKDEPKEQASEPPPRPKKKGAKGSGRGKATTRKPKKKA
jgi:thiol-disulfide isomerase/thioredoxin